MELKNPEPITDRLNKLRMERENLEITLMGLDAFIERLEIELDFHDERKAFLKEMENYEEE